MQHKVFRSRLTAGYSPAMSNSLYRSLPGVDTLLAEEALAGLSIGHELRAEAARAAIHAARASIARGDGAPNTQQIAQDAAERALATVSPLG
jgi:hypothetical protein